MTGGIKKNTTPNSILVTLTGGHAGFLTAEHENCLGFISARQPGFKSVTSLQYDNCMNRLIMNLYSLANISSYSSQFRIQLFHTVFQFGVNK